MGTRLRMCVLAASALTLASCDDNDERRFITVFRIPSPAGSAVVTKTYPSSQLYYDLTLSTRGENGRTNTTKLAAEGARHSRDDPVVFRGPTEDGVVVGWMGENHLFIGWLNGDDPPSGVLQAGAVEVTRVSYEVDIDKTIPRRRDQVILQDVKYTTETTTNNVGLGCSIKVEGVDGRFFSKVFFSLTAFGTRTREEYGPHTFGAGSVALRFSLAQLPESRSPALTPTQAKLGDFGPYVPGKLPQPGPLQDGLGMIYSGYDWMDTLKFFRLLHDGGYRIRFNLTFGEQQIDYIVREPITIEAATAFQVCETRTLIFTDLIGRALSR